ncbi:acyl carrier protein [Methylobacterium nodulans]|uniref:Acyl carrier protein n=1 Tax=Methylobacterium nodulans (strain LMG 21967 / CNCM I-2342 / ORS 2060) TaxID=460265 RepID=B8IPX4_METNO|nr:acyl carrier protein [Methylobacterium nodulans]ACL56624.1 phosphopantetheine-binding [Methylobacterium nodulans ORS 2060]
MQQNAIEATLIRILEEVAGVDRAAISRDRRLREELGVDSLSLVDVAVAAEDALGLALPDEELERARTVGDVIDFIRRATASAEIVSPRPS